MEYPYDVPDYAHMAMESSEFHPSSGINAEWPLRPGKQPRIKLSEDVMKVSIPCKKKCYRLYGKEGYPLVDIMTGEDQQGPKIDEK
ncbi:hypothetical protein, partial [Klebsiella pneumoniae]|uniref:hypothetical protein n=1 Tax=Klebsiella pneumoniae TaxID=573 RepID=UPI003B59015F